MRDNFRYAIELVLKHEGGYVDHPKDPGGATNLGITLKVLAAFRGMNWRKMPKTAVRKLGSNEAKCIYRMNYWDKSSADELPSGLDYCVLDYAVNSGVSRSAKVLQRIVGAKVDGVIGLGTLGKVQNYGHPANIISIMCNRRLSWLYKLQHWNVFGKGWTHRVNQVKRDAMRMSVDHNIAYEEPSAVVDNLHKKSIKELAIEAGLWGFA